MSTLPAGIVSWLRRYYDRLAGLAVLFGLLASLVYLAVRVGMIQEIQRRWDEEMAAVRPQHPEAAKVDPSTFERAVLAIEKPFAVESDAWSNRMTVPETRVWCVDCRRPIPFQATVCTFCRSEQPPEKETREDYDGDQDQMWDSWEKKYGLNPFDPADAMEDADGDKFTNLAEFKADPRTDPTNPASFPPPEKELWVERIRANPFQFLFKSTIRLPGDRWKFGINTRPGSKTYFVGLGDSVEGFAVTKFEEKFETQDAGGVRRRMDVSVLTLTRGERQVALVKDRQFAYDEYEIDLLFRLDNARFTVKPSAEIELRGRKFQIIEVDSPRQRVLIVGLHDDKRTWVEKIPNMGTGGQPGPRAPARKSGGQGESSP